MAYNYNVLDVIGNPLNGIYLGTEKYGAYTYVIFFEKGKSIFCFNKNDKNHFGRTSSFYQEWGEYTLASLEDQKELRRKCKERDIDLDKYINTIDTSLLIF